MTVRLVTTGLDAVISGHERRQELYAMRAALLCRRYVPREEGYLRASEPLSSRYRQGLLVWSTPYAAYQYYVPTSHTTAGTCDHWDERCAKDNRSELLGFARKLIEEG